MDIQSIVNPVLQDLLYAGVVSLVGFIIGLAKSKLGTERMKKIGAELYHKQNVASDAVNYVEQKFSDLSSNDKFNKASEWISNNLAQKGIKVSSSEIEVLIESTLARFKDVFGKEWNAAEGEPTTTVETPVIVKEPKAEPVQEAQSEESVATPTVAPATVDSEVAGESTPSAPVNPEDEYPVAVDPVGK